MKSCFALAVLVCGALPLSANAGTTFTDGDRVLFLGDSITREGSWHALISLFYQTRYPERKIVWLNGGISGDTTAGALRRLEWDVRARKPNRVVLMLGMNDVAREDLPGLVGGHERVTQYRKNLEVLTQSLLEQGCDVILCTPSPYDATAQFPSPANPAVNPALAECAAICRELARIKQLPLVDFYPALHQLNLDFQKTNPKFSVIGTDRIHPGVLGATVMAYLFLQAQGVNGVVSETRIAVADPTAATALNAQLSGLQVTAKEVRFALLENALPMPLDSEVRKAAHLVPLTEQLNRQILKVEGLEEGEYELLLDDQPVRRLWSQELAGGVNLSNLRSTPQYAQAVKVAAANTLRHKLASSAPRMMAFTRAMTLRPAGIAEQNTEAVTTFLEKLIADPEAPQRADLGSGGFAQTMAKQYLANRSRELAIDNEIAAATMEISRLNSPRPHNFVVRPVRQIPSQEQRAVLFAARHGTEQQEKTAADFLRLLVLDQPMLKRSNLCWRSGWKPVADLAQAGRKMAALAAYRDYFFDKLRFPAVYGIPASLLALPPVLLKPENRLPVIARADSLMRGVFPHSSHVMFPGNVWLSRKPGGPNGTVDCWSPEVFQPLVEAYLLTGEGGYLTRWIEYLEDWAMFESAAEAVSPTDISDNDSQSIGKVLAFCQMLAGVARLQPLAKNDFPPDSLARILGKMVRVYPPLTLLYHESNSQNWTPGGTASLLQAAVLLDEFRVSEEWFTRARRRHESYGTLQFLPDGGETEHALWYNCHYFSGAMQALELAEARAKVEEKMRVAWEREFCAAWWARGQEARLEERARFFLQMLTPQSQYPIGNRSDRRKLPDWNSARMIDRALRRGAPDLKTLSDCLFGVTQGGDLGFTMSSFPYTGSYLMRSGWTNRDSYAHFFSSPFPVGGHALPGLKANNSFYLSCEGQDLLVSGGVGSYSYDRSPLRVDGKEQFAHAGISNPGINKNHKGFGIAYVDPQPSSARLHSSANFDFAEGTYSGPYGDFVDDHHDNKDYRVDFLAECARRVITGVTHQRQVLFIKQPRLWVVVDRLRSAVPHTFAMDWRLPAEEDDSSMRPRSQVAGHVFSAKAIQTDQIAQTIMTSAPEGLNLRMHQFGLPLTYSVTREDAAAVRKDYTNRYRMYDFWRVSGEWRGVGEGVVVSLIEVVASGGKSTIVQLEKLPEEPGACGFQAIDVDGQRMRFSAGANGAVELQLGERGMSIGETSYEYFRAQRIPIERPVAPVRIESRSDCTGTKQEITLHCVTQSVELRYTLDGVDPTPGSVKYEHPFALEREAIIKARAFRPGTLPAATVPSGTSLSPVAVAHIRPYPHLSAVGKLTDSDVKPGLEAVYSEGNWRDLTFFPDRVPPVKRLVVKNLFDHCRPDAETVFRWAYAGYLAVPADGVYTFYAPQELVSSAHEQGYDLRVMVGRKPGEIVDDPEACNRWYPATARNDYGAWSIGLKQGLHPFHVWYVDYRTDAAERMNHPGMRTNTIWDGGRPVIKISSHELPCQEIPASWLYIKTSGSQPAEVRSITEKP